jgi:hypothetical protein
MIKVKVWTYSRIDNGGKSEPRPNLIACMFIVEHNIPLGMIRTSKGAQCGHWLPEGWIETPRETKDLCVVWSNTRENQNHQWGSELLWVNHYHGECSKPPAVLRTTRAFRTLLLQWPNSEVQALRPWGDSLTEVLAFLVLFPLMNLSLISFSHIMYSKALSWDSSSRKL